MAIATCGWCGENTHVTEAERGRIFQYRRELPSNLPIVQGIFTCDHCGRLLIGSKFSGDRPRSSELGDLKPYWDTSRPDTWSPNFVQGQSFSDVPTHIAQAASEAYTGASVGNSMSAILMARTVIEASAKDKGVLTGSLLNKIDELENKALIRADTKEAAHAIRKFANDMAHGDISEPVTTEDAEEVLVLMNEILNELFQGPARVKAIKAKVAARKAKP